MMCQRDVGPPQARQPSGITSTGALHGPHTEPVYAITLTRYGTPASRFATTADVVDVLAPNCHDTPPSHERNTRYDSTNGSNGADHDTTADNDPGTATTPDTANGCGATDAAADTSALATD